MWTRRATGTYNDHERAGQRKRRRLMSLSTKEKPEADSISAGSKSASESAPAPECIYFYYLKPENTDHADVLAFVADMKIPLKDGDINPLVDRFITEVRNEAYVHLMPMGHFFEDITWTRQSYLVIVVDDPRYQLLKNDIELSDSSHTIKHEESITSAFPEVSGVRYRNYITRKDGGTWSKHKDEKEEFEIEMEFKPRLSAGESDPRSHEDSGTNLGPPLPPP